MSSACINELGGMALQRPLPDRNYELHKADWRAWPDTKPLMLSRTAGASASGASGASCHKNNWGAAAGCAGEGRCRLCDADDACQDCQSKEALVQPRRQRRGGTRRAAIRGIVARRSQGAGQAGQGRQGHAMTVTVQLRHWWATCFWGRRT